MLKELVDKAEKLEAEGKMNPIGYGQYSEPIKWVVHIYPDEDRIEIEEYAGENRPRPKPANRAGKTVFPCPFADEAGYILGVAEREDGRIDDIAARKHEAYLGLLEEMAGSSHFSQPLLQEAIEAITKGLRNGSVMSAFIGKDAFNKAWMTFVFEKGYLRNKHLHELRETKDFWTEKVSQKVGSESTHACSICGRKSVTVKNIPSKVTLKSRDRQLASFNQNSFVSFRFNKDGASLGMCMPCAEKSSQALNYLLRHNSQTIYEDKTASGRVNNDSPRNQLAVYWLKEEVDFSVEGQEFNLRDLLSMPVVCPDSIRVETTEELVNKFLKTPWSGQSTVLNLDENAFYLAILSPNTGRIAVRDWFQVSAGEVKANLSQYFDGLRLVDSLGKQRAPYTIEQLLAPLGDVDPNMAKSLIRSAYLGEKPPFSLFQAAVRRLRISGARDGSMESNGQPGVKKRKGLEPREVWQRLCTIIKFYLTFGKEDAQAMETLERNRNSSAYQAGRLLAVLEEVQRRAVGGTLSTTLVDRYYGSASTAPFMVFPVLISMATKAHMPKIRKKNNHDYTELESVLEEIMTRIDRAQGFPRTLSLAQQGEFALGFYHQRAEFAVRRTKN